MSAVLLALYKDHDVAGSVRTYLVRDGFPTDRVEVTDCIEPGRAGLQPADSLHGKLSQYFRTLFRFEDERSIAELLVERVESGAAAVAVHPRGPIETARATEILESAGPMELAKHDLASQAFEHAAARHDTPWIRNFWIQSTGESECIYCRMFERGSD